jgi:hypothetical protein
MKDWQARMETEFRERFLKQLPQLLNNVAFRKEFIEALGEEGSEILTCIRENLPFEEGDEDDVFDVAHEAYSSCAKEILTLAWDGYAPGMSGTAWIICCGEVYVIGSSDYDDLGPFSSLEEALQEECFNIVTANPELESRVLPKKKLLGIARQIVDWENEGTITINSKLYRVSGDKLVLGAEN